MTNTGEGPVDISRLIQQVIEKEVLSGTSIRGNWEEIVGHRLARYMTPVSLKNGTLKVHVLDNVWKHHLELYGEELLNKINAGNTIPIVRQLLIKVGPLSSQDEPSLSKKAFQKIKKKGSTRKKSAKKVPKFPLTLESKEFLKQLRDPELKALAQRLLELFPPESKISSKGANGENNTLR